MNEAQPFTVEIALEQQAFGAKIASAIFDVVTRCNRPGTAVDMRLETNFGQRVIVGQASAVGYKELRITPVDEDSFRKWTYYGAVRITAHRWNLLTEGRESDDNGNLEVTDLAVDYYTRFGRVLNDVLNEM